MEYKVIATSYMQNRAKKQAAGWLPNELKVLTKELNRLAAQERWAVKSVSSTAVDNRVVYTVLLEREKL